MDVFERVREVNRGAGLSEEHLTSARARLLTGIDAGVPAERARRVRRPLFLVAGAVAGVAAATAGVVMLSQLTAPEPRVEAVPVQTLDPRPHGDPLPRPSATSGTGATEPFPGTTPQAGQYLHVTTTVDSLLYRDARVTVFTWPWHQDGLAPIGALLVRDHSETFVPADRSGEWRGSNGPNSQRLQFFPEDQWPAGELAWDNLFPANDSVGRWTFTGGFDTEVGPPTGSTEYFAQFPRDPQALLEFAKSFERGYEMVPEQADEAAVITIMDALRSNVAPADLREALISALALSPLVEATPSGGTVIYRARFQHIDARTDTLTVDTTTGWMSEYTLRYDRTDGADGDMVPTDVPDIRYTATVSIVDAIP
ncbi:hypothetical protein [Microbacterium sufflavum]|uniref:DUF4179 domain-containing protein n=2 Tax=Microbacterium TaxID=33882 RepID=A0ABY4IK42_9MICO|nr:hypothetical protein [Microbacterium sufflavum]UPL12462.1 hypothetical protein KV394_15680 [Microbacterium sufflavum]